MNVETSEAEEKGGSRALLPLNRGSEVSCWGLSAGTTAALAQALGFRSLQNGSSNSDRRSNEAYG